MGIQLKTLRNPMRDSTISSLEKSILVDLLLYAGVDGEAYPSQKTLADNHGCTDRQVRRALAELHKKGWITGWKKRGFSKSNKYSFNVDIYVLNEDSVRTFMSSH